VRRWKFAYYRMSCHKCFRFVRRPLRILLPQNLYQKIGHAIRRYWASDRS